MVYAAGVGNSKSSGIYVEIFMRKSVDDIWSLTQEPQLHERWDLRFDRIQYLPRESASEPQRFLYETRIGFGLSIKGTGESVGERELESGESTSSLKFDSADWKSLIRQGSGYWRYIPIADGLRFLTWYDYQVRFGVIGRVVDRIAFRPLIGWATAWSFDRLRLWAETGQLPETSMSLAIIHAIARVTIAFIWIWHGLVPKLLFRQFDERVMLSQAAIPLLLLPWIGVGEIAIGILILAAWRSRSILIVNGALMVVALAAVAVKSPLYIVAAFNPVTLNLGVVALSAIAWFASRNLPSASRCLRKDPRGKS